MRAERSHPPRSGGQTGHILERALHGLFLAVVILAPLPFGSARPWSSALIAAVIGVLVAAWAGLATMRVLPTVKIAPIAPATVGYMVVLAWAILQVTPIGVLANPLWHEACGMLGTRDCAGTISVDRFATWTSIMMLMAYGGAFFLAYQLYRDDHRAHSLLDWIIRAVAAYSIYGLYEYFTGNRYILWFDKWAYRTDLTSTFVNHSHFASYAGLGVISALAVLLETLRRDLHGGSRTARLRSAAERLLEKGLPTIVALILVGTALVLSHSRGGFAATLLAVLLVTGMAAAARVAAGPILRFFLILAVLVFGLIVVVSGGEVMQRMMDTQGDPRTWLFTLALGAIGDNPWQGTGLGTFSNAFRVIRPPGHHEFDWASFDSSHNVYLDAGIELGLPATLVIIACLGWLTTLCVRGVFTRKRSPHIPLAGLGATALVGFHGTVDFTLQIPGFTLTYMALLGAACAQSWSTRHREAPRPSGQVSVERRMV